MKVLDGRKLAARILSQLKRDIRRRKRKPALAVVLAGNDPASELYVSLKQKAAGLADMDFWVLKFSARDSEKDILQAIRELNRDPSIDGIIVQLPLPRKFNTQKIVNTVDPKKDADGFSPKAEVAPVFPSAIIKLLESAASKAKLSDKKFSFERKKALIVANSAVFGKEMVATLKRKKILAQYILSKNLKSRISNLKSSDIVITAVGKPGLIKGSMLKSGAVVIDGGITRKGRKVLGDVDRVSVSKVASALSPVPGGAGPLTIVCLLQNVFQLSRK